MSRVKKAEAKFYGEVKRPYQFSITETASNLLDECAIKLGVSRSEVIEQSVRGNFLNVIKGGK